MGASAHALWLSGLPPMDAKAVALRLVSEGYGIARGLADGAAAETASVVLQTAAGVSEGMAAMLAIAMGQRGFIVETCESPSRRSRARKLPYDPLERVSSRVASRDPGG